MPVRDIPVEECLRRLGSSDRHIGRVGFDDGSGPVIFPVNFRLHEGSVVFRTHAGKLHRAAQDNLPAAFEVDSVNTTWREGWSIIVRGRLVEVTDPATREVLDAQIWAWDESHTKSTFVSVQSTSITGRELL